MLWSGSRNYFFWEDVSFTVTNVLLLIALFKFNRFISLYERLLNGRDSYITSKFFAYFAILLVIQIFLHTIYPFEILR